MALSSCGLLCPDSFIVPVSPLTPDPSLGAELGREGDNLPASGSWCVAEAGWEGNVPPACPALLMTECCFWKIFGKKEMADAHFTKKVNV